MPAPVDHQPCPDHDPMGWPHPCGCCACRTCLAAVGAVRTDELQPGMSIRNHGQQDRKCSEGDALDVLHVGETDGEGMVTVTTTTGQFRYSAYWPQDLYTPEHADLIACLVIEEQHRLDTT